MRAAAALQGQRRRPRGGTAVLVALAAWLAGCAALTSAPADTAPPAPTTWGLNANDRYLADSGAPPPGAADLRWWQRFDDPALAAWVDRALAANIDLALARERVPQAQAQLLAARAQRGPSVGASAELEFRGRRSGDERRLQPGAALTLDFDTDLWGGLGAAERAAAAGLLRSQDLVQATRLATAALAARAYIEWRVALADATLLEAGLALQSESLRIVRVRVEAGLSPVLDRDRALAELATTEAALASALERSAGAASALQVLAGARPRALAAPSPDAAPVALEGAAPLGRPIDLLRARPDLRAAENALLVAAAEVGVAEAALRPRLRLPASLVFGGGAGTAALELVSATLAAALDLTLYDGGARRAGVDAARSRVREAELLYRRTLLLAVQQVEDAAAARQGAQTRIAARQRALAAAVAAQTQADTLYRAGLSGFLDLLISQRSALDNRRALLQAQGEAALNAVRGFEALGLIDNPA